MKGDAQTPEVEKLHLSRIIAKNEKGESVSDLAILNTSQKSAKFLSYINVETGEYYHSSKELKKTKPH